MHKHAPWYLLSLLIVYPLIPCAEGKKLPVPGSLKSLEGAYQQLLLKIENLPLIKQQEELSQFWGAVVKPRRKDFFGVYVDPTAYGNMCMAIGTQLQRNKSLIAMEEKIEKAPNSLKDFTYAFGQYKTLSEAQRKGCTGSQLWKGALKYGTLAQIEELVSLVSFSPDHSDAVYRCMMRYAIDEQISLVDILFKKYSGFASYIEDKKTEQNNAAWPISLRNCIAHNQPESVVDHFKNKNGEVNDQLFMNGMKSFLTVKDMRYQNAVVNVHETWSGTVCPNDNTLRHSTYEKTWGLVSRDTSGFKKVLESDAGVAITQWWAKVQMFMREECLAKKSPGKDLPETIKNRYSSLMKGIESAFARISSESASSFHHADDNVRSAMHGGILCVLLSENTTTKEKAYGLCERALKSGINIAEQGYMPYVVKTLPDSSVFLKLIEPYSNNNLDVCYALGQLYEDGYSLSMERETGKNKGYEWFKRDLKKARELYTRLLEKGDSRAFVRWLSLIHEDSKGKDEEEQKKILYDTMQYINGICDRFPNNSSLCLYQSLFICKHVSEITKDTINEHAIVYMDRLAQQIESIKSKLGPNSFDSPYFAALKASYKSLNYAVQKTLGASVDLQNTMEEIADCVYATYMLSANRDSFLLPEISNYFDASIFIQLRNYAEKLLNKDPKIITEKDLYLLATVGYVVLHTHIQQGLGKDEKLFINNIIRLSSHSDMQIQWPPIMHIMHIIALYGSNERDDSSNSFWQHLKAALQDEVTPEELDPAAQYEAEQTLEIWSKGGSVLAQMYLVKHNKSALRETIKKLLFAQKPLVMPTESFSDYVKKVEECGGYAFLKERFTASKCAVCDVDMRRLLFSWIDLLIACYSKAQIDSKDPKYEKFFNDMKLINVDTQQE